MDMQGIISQLAVLFLLIAGGYLVGKVNLLTADATRYLSKIVLFVTTPCTILNSVINGSVGLTGGETVFFVLMSLLVFPVFFIIAIPVARAMGGEKRNHGLYSYMASFGNVTFMGFPVTAAIFGAASAYYVALYNIPFMVLTFSVGIIMVSGKRGSFDPKTLITPSLIAALLAIPLALTGFKAPTIVADAVRITSGMTTPGSMFVIGSTLSRVSFKNVFTKWRLYPVAFLKLAVIPLVIWFVFRFFVSDGMMLGVLVVLCGMPTGAMAAMFAIEYGADEKIASSGVFLTTLLSGLTIPLIVYFLFS